MDTHRFVVAIELAAIDVGAALQVGFCRRDQQGCMWDADDYWRTCEHGYDAENDLFDALNGTPTFGCLFVHGRIISRGVEDGYADGTVRVNYDDVR